MGNEIYSKVGDFDTKTKSRIHTFIDFINYHSPENAKVADLGSGNGFIASHFSNCDRYDFYPQDETVMFCDLQKEHNKTKSKYDVVILSHTLEHLDYAKLAMKIIHNEFLNSGGMLFVAVPNGLFIHSKHEPLNVEIGHITTFTPGSLNYYISSRFTMVNVVENNLFVGWEELLGYGVKI